MSSEPDHQAICAKAVEDALEAARALADAEHAEPSYRSELARTYWSAVQRVMDAVIFAASNGIALPPRLLFLLATFRDHAGDLAVGNIPEPILHVRSRGSRGVGPAEERHIRRAVTYRAAVRAGLIDDPSPTKTVAETFGVDESTAKGWFRKYEPYPIADTAEVERLAREAGQFYRQAGRSNKAKLDRNVKRGV